MSEKLSGGIKQGSSVLHQPGWTVNPCKAGSSDQRLGATPLPLSALYFALT